MNQKGFILISTLLIVSTLSLLMIYLYASYIYDQTFLEALISKRAGV